MPNPSWKNQSTNGSAGNSIHCQLLVIGAGMAGMAASVFAANRGIKIVQVGIPGEILYASGLLDLLGVHPIEKRKRRRNPWVAIDAVSRDLPAHPYSRMTQEDIRKAWDELLYFLDEAGLPYHHYKNRNVEIITPIGTLKLTYAAPESMWSGVIAWQKKRPCLLVGFQGLKGFSVRQIQSTLQDRWPHLRSVNIFFPGNLTELYPERMALALELLQNREKLASEILNHLSDAQVVGLPAICGIYRSAEVFADLQKKIGCSIFEVPTIPPGITGMRLKEAFARHLPQLGVQTFYQKKVRCAKVDSHQKFILEVGGRQTEVTVRADAVILASGRFIGQGLAADRQKIRETIFDLPVYQPNSRNQWYRYEFFAPRGHAVNQAGIEIDSSFRPLNANGRPAFKHLYAAGSILAHQDWIRMKCGSGLAIASAYGAVNALCKHMSFQK